MLGNKNRYFGPRLHNENYETERLFEDKKTLKTFLCVMEFDIGIV